MDATRPPAQASFGGIDAELWPCGPYKARYAGGPGVIGFAYEAQDGEDAIASDRVRPFRRGANTLAWIPPGCGVFSASRTGGEYPRPARVRGGCRGASRRNRAHGERRGEPVRRPCRARAAAFAAGWTGGGPRRSGGSG